MEDLNCPYCGNEETVCHDDGYGYDEDTIHSQTCDNCGKTYGFTTSISYHYEAQEMNCANGSEHTYEPTMIFPKCFTEMQCSQCGKKRPLTEKERVNLKIPTIAEYEQELTKLNELKNE